MLQIFICILLLFYPKIMLTSNYASSQQRKFEYSAPTIKNCCIKIKTVYIQLNSIESPETIHVPQATLIPASSIIYVEAQPYAQQSHEYQPTRSISLMAFSIQERMSHR